MSRLRALRRCGLRWHVAVVAAMLLTACQVAAVNGEQTSLASSINAFGDQLFTGVAATAGDPPEGLFLSPFGVAQALGMLLNGVESSDSPSYQQITAAVLGASAGNQVELGALNSEMANLTASLVQPPTDNLTVSNANSVWLEPEWKLQPAFVATLSSTYGAEAQPITTANAVNSWVSNATYGKINSIVDEGTLSQAVLLLINALYFKGKWVAPFDKDVTAGAPFTYLDGSKGQVAMMSHEFAPGDRSGMLLATLPAGEGGLSCQAVRLPYRGGEYAALAALPLGQLSSAGGQLALTPGTTGSTAEKPSGSTGSSSSSSSGATPVPYAQALAACRSALLTSLASATGPAGAFAGASSTGSSASGNSSQLTWAVPKSSVVVQMPRFELTFDATLNSPLQSLGITAPFAGGDLTKIATTAAGTPASPAVDTVIQKVYIKVDEEGTEAAAVTGIIAVTAMPAEPTVVKLDRPFVFTVVHEPSGLALFTGQLYQPEEWAEE